MSAVTPQNCLIAEGASTRASTEGLSCNSNNAILRYPKFFHLIFRACFKHKLDFRLGEIKCLHVSFPSFPPPLISTCLKGRVGNVKPRRELSQQGRVKMSPVTTGHCGLWQGASSRHLPYVHLNNAQLDVVVILWQPSGNYADGFVCMHVFWLIWSCVDFLFTSKH